MTYSIIPPIFVVLSLIGIILFLMKKAPKVASINERKNLYLESSVRVQENGKRGLASGDKYLMLMEKITRLFKAGLIKMENAFSSWNEKIRTKRKQNGTASSEINAVTIQRMEETNVQENNISVDMASSSVHDENMPSMPKQKRITIFDSEKPVQPMISKKVTMPKVKVELKDRLEKLLIERIAANPKDIEAYERLGEYYFEIGNMEYSKDCFKQVIRLDPGNTNAKSKMRRLENLLRR